jgi:CBS domain-containing protein
MKISEHCKRKVVSISSATDVTTAARLMREAHVGFLIVHEEGDALRKPVGVLTDRDIVLQIIARDVDPKSVTVADIMTRQPLVAKEADDLPDLLQAMRLAGIRRVPVVDARGALSGIMALDDAIDLVTGLLCEISGSIKSEQRQEWRARQG